MTSNPIGHYINAYSHHDLFIFIRKFTKIVTEFMKIKLLVVRRVSWLFPPVRLDKDKTLAHYDSNHEERQEVDPGQFD